MSISQNVRFRMGMDKKDSSSSPPGERLTIELSDALKNGGWQPGDYDNWRDMGGASRSVRGLSVLQYIWLLLSLESGCCKSPRLIFQALWQSYSAGRHRPPRSHATSLLEL